MFLSNLSEMEPQIYYYGNYGITNGERSTLAKWYLSDIT